MSCGNGNDSDKAKFATILSDFKKQVDLDSIFIADSVLYSAENLLAIKHLKWITRVSLSIKAGRVILATNVLKNLSSSEILTGYKGQQSCERGFRFLKDPLFFADSVFLKYPSRVETMAMLMGLSLLVYSIGQRQLRANLKQNNTGVKNPDRKVPTRRGSLRRSHS